MSSTREQIEKCKISGRKREGAKAKTKADSPAARRRHDIGIKMCSCCIPAINSLRMELLLYIIIVVVVVVVVVASAAQAFARLYNSAPRRCERMFLALGREMYIYFEVCIHREHSKVRPLPF